MSLKHWIKQKDQSCVIVSFADTYQTLAEIYFSVTALYLGNQVACLAEGM